VKPDDERIDAAEGFDLKQLQTTLVASAKKAGTTAVTSGKWLAEWLVDNAPRIPVRDAATLSRHHGGLTGDALATALIQAASRASAGVGAAVGGLAGVQALVPPTWVALPFELLVETAAVATIELKLVAELHEVYGRSPQVSTKERALLVVRAWAERRGITPASLSTGGGITTRGVREELIRVVRRRLIRRAGRNLSSLVPLFVGAAAGAVANRRATKAVGEAIAEDLQKLGQSP
jgi:uncharacterized protein (DUF697 family)